MRGCMQFLAGIIVVAFVVTTAFVLVADNVLQIVTSRESLKQALNLDGWVAEAIPELVAAAIREQARARGFPDTAVAHDVLQAALTDLIPPDWLAEQTDQAVDALFDYVETGDPAAAEILVDTGPLLARFRGEAGQQFTLALVRGLPICTDPALALDLVQGDGGLPGCVPAQIPLEQTAAEVHRTLVRSLEEDSILSLQAQSLRLSLASVASSPDALIALQRGRSLFLLIQRWHWLLWLLPLGCLVLIALLAVRSLSELGNWWGWSLLLGSLFALAIVVLVPALTTLIARLVLSALAVAGLELPAGQLSGGLLASLGSLWFRRVIIQVSTMAAAGLFLVLVGLIAPRRS